MKKLFSLAAAALLVGSLASVSAFAADAPKTDAPKAAPAKAAPKKVAAAHHMKSCDDYAYESQAAKDCAAKGDMKMKKSTKATKTSATKKAPAEPKKAM